MYWMIKFIYMYKIYTHKGTFIKFAFCTGYARASFPAVPSTVNREACQEYNDLLLAR